MISFMIINFLVQTLQSTDKLILDLFCPWNKKNKQTLKNDTLATFKKFSVFPWLLQCKPTEFETDFM